VKTLSRYVIRWIGPRRVEGPGAVVTVAYKTVADGISKLVMLVVTIVAARTLAAADFGVLALAMTTGWLLSVASDAGLPLDLARQLARAAARGERPAFAFVRDAMRARLLFAAIAAAGGVLIGAVVVPFANLGAFTVVVVALLLNACLETAGHAFRGLGRTDIEASLNLAQRAAAGIGACLALAAGRPLVWVGAALAGPAAGALTAALVIARRMTATNHADEHTASGRPLSSRFAREVAPVGAGVLLSALYFRCDVYFVERWHGLDTVGLYNGAFRIVEALRLVPAAVMAVMFPVFCTARTWGPLRSVVAALLPLGLLFTAALYAAAAMVLAALYGPRFVVAEPALSVLALALPFFFVNYALTHQVIAWDGQIAYLRITAAAFVANVIANSLLIPAGGMRGAAVATLLTEVVVAAGCVWALAVRTESRSPVTAAAVPGIGVVSGDSR
jgi:O-antigen/teichoic acid export membrane protein